MLNPLLRVQFCWCKGKIHSWNQNNFIKKDKKTIWIKLLALKKTYQMTNLSHIHISSCSVLHIFYFKINIFLFYASNLILLDSFCTKKIWIRDYFFKTQIWLDDSPWASLYISPAFDSKAIHFSGYNKVTPITFLKWQPYLRN